MTHRSPPTAWQNGSFIDHSELRIDFDDIGFRQGVIAVERLRTYGGNVAQLNRHVIRWRRTLEELYLTLGVVTDEIAARIGELLRLNQTWLDQVGDCGIVMLASPGITTGPSPAQPNQWMHLIELDHARIAAQRTHGQRLFITDVQQPADRCWPRDIKVRCRLHYYLADAQAREHHRDAIGLLVDHDGTVTETSVANIAIVRGDVVYSPPVDQVLPGITEACIRELVQATGRVWNHEALWPAEIREADEVWLMGTDGGLWYASHVDGSPVGKGPSPGTAGPIYSEILKAFDKH